MKAEKKVRKFAGVNLDVDTMELLRKKAAEEGRSISSMIAFFVRQGVSTGTHGRKGVAA